MTQTWQPEGYALNARFVSDLGAPVVALLAPRAGERILDLGCGDGPLTEALAASGAEVVGVDASAEMVAAAKARGLDARVADATALPFEAEFDAVFTNAVLHWVTDIEACVAGVARALKARGRFVGEFGGFGNIAAIATALRAVLTARGDAGAAGFSPWYYPTEAEFARVLEGHGFAMETAEIIPRPTPLPTGMAGWLATFARPFLARLPEPDRETALAEAVTLLRPSLCDASGNWIADYVRLRFRAVLRG